MKALIKSVVLIIRVIAFILKQLIRVTQTFAEVLRGCWFHLICLEKSCYNLWNTDEFHYSLNYDVEDASFMTENERRKYGLFIADLRRRIHEKGL
jgi:hypothetical protein